MDNDQLAALIVEYQRQTEQRYERQFNQLISQIQLQLAESQRQNAESQRQYADLLSQTQLQYADLLRQYNIIVERLDNDLDNAPKYLAEARVGGGTHSRYSVKLVELPLQPFTLVNYSIDTGGSYDTLYIRAISEVALESIPAFDSETRQNVIVDIAAGELFTIVGNSKLLTLFRASPIVTPAVMVLF